MTEPFIYIILNILFGILSGTAVSLAMIYLRSQKKRRRKFSDIRVRFLKVMTVLFGLIGIVLGFMVLIPVKFSWTFFTVGGILAVFIDNSIYFLATKKIIRTKKERHIDIPYKE